MWGGGTQAYPWVSVIGVSNANCQRCGVKERIALVIGNSNYEEIGPLANPRNDAQDVAARLQAFLGYGHSVKYTFE